MSLSYAPLLFQVLKLVAENEQLRIQELEVSFSLIPAPYQHAVRLFWHQIGSATHPAFASPFATSNAGGDFF